MQPLLVVIEQGLSCVVEGWAFFNLFSWIICSLSSSLNLIYYLFLLVRTENHLKGLVNMFGLRIKLSCRMFWTTQTFVGYLWMRLPVILGYNLAT